VKSIGVSNFAIHHLDDLATTATVVPAVNQIDLHPLKTSTALRAFCAAHGIQVEAWAPLAQGRLFDRKELAAIASRYGKTIPQVVLRWHLQNEIVVIPKSNHPQRLAENIDIFDFELSPEHIAEISAMNEDLLVLGFDSDHIPEAILVPPAANWPYSL
jgi:diketogulonate reductase-like aldo/keto reductase